MAIKQNNVTYNNEYTFGNTLRDDVLAYIVHDEVAASIISEQEGDLIKLTLKSKGGKVLSQIDFTTSGARSLTSVEFIEHATDPKLKFNFIQSDPLYCSLAAIYQKINTNTQDIAALKIDVADLIPRMAQAEEDIVELKNWVTHVKLDGGEVKALYSLTPTLSYVIANSGNPTTVPYKGTGSNLLFTAETGYVLPEKITVSDVQVGNIATSCGTCIAQWSKSEGKLTISQSVNDIVFIITGVTEA